jgi:hypothetical protein
LSITTGWLREDDESTALASTTERDDMDARDKHTQTLHTPEAQAAAAAAGGGEVRQVRVCVSEREEGEAV